MHFIITCPVYIAKLCDRFTLNYILSFSLTVGIQFPILSQEMLISSEMLILGCVQSIPSVQQGIRVTGCTVAQIPTKQHCCQSKSVPPPHLFSFSKCQLYNSKGVCGHTCIHTPLFRLYSTCNSICYMEIKLCVHFMHKNICKVQSELCRTFLYLVTVKRKLF